MTTAAGRSQWGWLLLQQQITHSLAEVVQTATLPLGGQGALGQGGSKDQVQVIKLQAQLKAAKDEIDKIGGELQPLVVQCGRDTLDKLELAMAKVYKLAVFVRGAYDDRDPDLPQRDALLKQILDAFQAMDDVAEAGLKSIGDRHSAVMELQNAKIIPAKNEIELLVQQVSDELSNIEDQIRSAQSGVEALRQNVSTQEQALKPLYDRISEAEKAKTASDVVFTILTFGISNLINANPLDSLGPDDQLDEVNKLLESAQQQLYEAQSRFYNLQNERTQLDSRLRFAQQTQSLTLPIISAAEATEFRSNSTQRRFSPLKAVASQLLVRVHEIQKGAMVTQSLAYSKKDFANGLLGICKEALIDRVLEDEVRMVRDEIINEYGGKLPEDVEELAAEVNERINTISLLPSLRQD